MATQRESRGQSTHFINPTLHSWRNAIRFLSWSRIACSCVSPYPTTTKASATTSTCDIPSISWCIRAGISLGLTGSQRACASTGNDQMACWMWLGRTSCHLVWRARNRFWHHVSWTPWLRANGSLRPLLLEEGSVLSVPLGSGPWDPKTYFPVLLGNNHEATDPWRWCRYRGNDVLFHHTTQLGFELFTYCNRYSAGRMLDRTHCWVNLDMVFAV